MSDTDTYPERFVAWSEDERDVAHFAFTQAARRILEDAGDDRIAKELLPDAAGTFAILSRLSRDLDIASGMTPPDAESIDIVASTIAAGLAPEAKLAMDLDIDVADVEWSAPVEPDVVDSHPEAFPFLAAGRGITRAPENAVALPSVDDLDAEPS